MTIPHSIPTTLYKKRGKYYLERILTDDLGETTQTLDINAKTGQASIKLPSRVVEDILAGIRAIEWRSKQAAQ